MTSGWTDIEEIAIGLDEGHRDVDPMNVSFPKLRKLVEGLPGFLPDPEHPVNEQILEAVQTAWIEERQDALADEDRDEGERAKPHNPFR